MRLIFNISLENRSSLCFSLLALHFTAFVAFLQVTGPCSRCQMVCVDQHTAQRSSEPLKTLIAQRGNKVPSWIHVANTKYCKVKKELRGKWRKVKKQLVTGNWMEDILLGSPLLYHWATNTRHLTVHIVQLVFLAEGGLCWLGVRLKVKI